MLNTSPISSDISSTGTPRRYIGRIGAFGLTAALSLSLLTAPAALAADAGTAHGPAGGILSPAPSGQTPERTALQQAMLDALARAKSTGSPVVVEAMTTEGSRTTANADGTLTTTDNAQAVRTRRNGAWADLDSTLRTNADGTISPAVASTALTLSGGGSGPMATVTTDDGKKLGLNAPFTLPAPALDGATATYADVLPGVDLQLTALPVGGWRDVIVVHTAEAAANPALKTLRFPVTAQGLNVTSDTAGAIDVKDDSGTVRFRSPAPLQWDSSTPPAATTAPAKSAAKSLAAAPAEAEAAPGVASTPEEPGDGANVAAITTKVSGGAIELTPNQVALGSGTGPWYLDPSLTAVTSYSQGSVEVQENHKTAENYNQKTNLATGYCGYKSSDPNLDCGDLGRQRAYFQFGINPAIYTVPGGAEVPPTVFSSTLNAQVTAASSPSTNTPFVVYWTPPINTHTNWNNQPCGTDGNTVMQGCTAIDGQWLTGTGPLAINVTATMQRAAAEKWPTWTVGIAPQSTEWEKLYRHYIASNPSITTTYDITPTIWDPRTSPTPGFAANNTSTRCTSGGVHPWDNPGWVGNNQSIYLTANSFSPAGQSLYTGFQMWDDNDPNFSALPGGWGGSYNNPGYTSSVGSLTDGHQYGWLARATDEILTSPSSAWCYFRVDKTNPRVSISSTSFPPSGTPNDNPTAWAGTAGTFTVRGEDPVPAGGQASGIACVRVSADPTPVVGWRCGSSDTYTADASGIANVPFTPRNWGTNLLYAWAMDNAGNYSQPAVYTFYAPWKPGTQPLFGDVDNDQKPDIVISDSKGDLRIIGGGTDPSRSVAAPAAAAPGHDASHNPTWSDYQITHRGTLNYGQAVDQLIAHNTKDPDLKKLLYLVTNDGTGRYDSLTAGIINRPTTCETQGTHAPCPGYNSSTWSDVTQVVAIGTPEGEAIGADPLTPSKTITMTRTSFLTVENGKLYLFSPGMTDDIDGTARLIPTLDNGSWNDYDLINPGAANGPTAIPDADNAFQATVWARKRDNGNIYAYAITGAATEPDYTTLTTPNSGTLILPGFGTPASHPQIGSSGDLNSDGYADLWVIDTTGSLAVFPGKSSTGTAHKVDGFTPYTVMGKADASVSIHSNLVDWLCADAEGGTNNGSPLAAYACWDGPNQKFNFAADGTIREGSYCLSTKDNALDNGTQLILARCEAKTGQKWAMRPDGRIYNTATATSTTPNGKCIELPGWATTQGTRLGIWDCPGLQANQQWTLKPERTT